MPMQLQEVHPALVHFPITLLPLAIGADLLGKATGRKGLCTAGKVGIAAAAGTGLLAGIFGLIAQEEVNVEGKSREMLITHRDLNLGAVATMGAMAVRRARREKPSLAYLGLGLGLIGAVTYSAYLGGHMVYADGVGVEKAGGTYGSIPSLGKDQPARIARKAARDLGSGALHTVQEIARGEIVPTITSGDGARRGAGASA